MKGFKLIKNNGFGNVSYNILQAAQPNQSYTQDCI